MKHTISRRATLRLLTLTGAAALAACQPAPAAAPATPSAQPSATRPPTQTPPPSPTYAAFNTGQPGAPVVYMTSEISADALQRIYASLGRAAGGKVAVKISSGEPGGHNYLDPALIAPLVSQLEGTLVECNTTYGGARDSTAGNQRALDKHGFSAIAPTDIMDADDSLALPVKGGKHLTEDLVGSHLANYDFVVNLAHFKGHTMGGFGGVIKNMSIGIASASGKSLIHSAGAQTSGFSMSTPQDDFLESMAEAAKAVADYLGERIVYINVMNRLSVDCDCDSHPAEPTMQDIGILGSLDPLALDQASVDLVYAAPDGADLVQRIETRNGIHTLEHGAALGLGSRQYRLSVID